MTHQETTAESKQGLLNLDQHDLGIHNIMCEEKPFHGSLFENHFFQVFICYDFKKKFFFTSKAATCNWLSMNSLLGAFAITFPLPSLEKNNKVSFHFSAGFPHPHFLKEKVMLLRFFKRLA